jgi:porphobilinogen deaminase
MRKATRQAIENNVPKKRYKRELSLKQLMALNNVPKTKVNVKSEMKFLEKLESKCSKKIGGSQKQAKLNESPTMSRNGSNGQ